MIRHHGTKVQFFIQVYLLEREINLNGLGIKSMRSQGKVLQFKLHLPTTVLVFFHLVCNLTRI